MLKEIIVKLNLKRKLNMIFGGTNFKGEKNGNFVA